MTHSRLWLLAPAAAMVLTAMAPGAQAQSRFTIMTTGGAWQDALRKAWFAPFSKETGITIAEQEHLGDLGKIKAMVDTGHVPIDLVNVETATVLQGCDEGILDHIDYGKIADRNQFIEGSALDCGVGLDAYGDILAYDPAVLTQAPASVLDIFDTRKFPGKRGMRKVPAQNLEWALMADGVAPADVYTVLGTAAGVDRAFRKLDTVKRDVVWWEAGALPPQLLAAKEVVMTTAWNGRIQNAIDNDRRGFKIVWRDQILEYDMIAIPRGASNTGAAYKFLAYVSTPENNAKLASFISYGPVRKEAERFVPAEALAKLPNDPAHLTSYLIADPMFWGDHGPDLVRRFNAWLAR